MELQNIHSFLVIRDDIHAINIVLSTFYYDKVMLLSQLKELFSISSTKEFSALFFTFFN